jgi:hypothetical protein
MAREGSDELGLPLLNTRWIAVKMDSGSRWIAVKVMGEIILF